MASLTALRLSLPGVSRVRADVSVWSRYRKWLARSRASVDRAMSAVDTTRSPLCLLQVVAQVYLSA